MSVLSLEAWTTKNEPGYSPSDVVDEKDITIVYSWEWFISWQKMED